MVARDAAERDARAADREQRRLREERDSLAFSVFMYWVKRESISVLHDNRKTFSKWAYEIADAMIAARDPA